MRWFFKCLRHYADFSGRAGRTEYWMFTLFSVIFSCLLPLLIAPAYMFMFDHGDAYYTQERTIVAGMVVAASYWAALGLPSLAAAVRRLHDLGKSGWMMFLVLIPVIGHVWLLVLMMLNGQRGANQYGACNKTAPEIFTEPARLKSAGITMIVATAVLWWQYIDVFLMVLDRLDRGARVTPAFALQVAASVLWLAAGILLPGEKQAHGMQRKGKIALILLLAAFSLFSGSAILIYMSLKESTSMGFPFVAKMAISSLSFPLMMLFLASVLFAPKNRPLIRGMGILVMSCLSLLFLLYVFTGADFMTKTYWPDMHGLYRLYLLAYSVLFPVACLVLAGTFLPRKIAPQ